MREPVELLRKKLGLTDPVAVEYQQAGSVDGPNYSRRLLTYNGNEGDEISAFLFTPHGKEIVGGVVVFHQHNSKFHLGKSEVAGDVGDPLQAFGPALAPRGVVVLAPDAVTFEDRRANTRGVEPEVDDWLQHYNGMAYRLINGGLFMSKNMDDAQRALSVLLAQKNIDPRRVGVFGHSYGGTTAMYLGALDKRCQFVGISGAVVTLRKRQERGTGINLMEAIPGLTEIIEIDDLIKAIVPRPVFVVSGTDDRYAADADVVVRRVNSSSVDELRVEGEHALDQVRHDAIVDWLVRMASRPA